VDGTTSTYTVVNKQLVTFLVGTVYSEWWGARGHRPSSVPACLFGCRPLRRVPTYSLRGRAVAVAVAAIAADALALCLSRQNCVTGWAEVYRRASACSRDQWVVRGGPENRRSTAPAYRALGDFVVRARVVVVIILLYFTSIQILL